MLEQFNLGALVSREAHGDRVLLTDCRLPEVPVKWTGNALEDQSDAVARALQARGLARGDRVAIVAENRAEYLTAYFGIMRAGLVAVPVNHKFPAATVEFVLSDAQVRFAFVDEARATLCPAGLEYINFDDDEAFNAFLDPGPFETLEPEPDEVAMFLYTSGSTGHPKGVPLTHQGHLWVVEHRLQSGLDYGAEQILVAAPLYHMNALALAKMAAVAGAPIVLLPRFTAASYIAAIERHRCTWLTSVPTMMALVTQQGELLSKTDTSSVDSVRMGSAPITAKLLAQVAASFPAAKIQMGYGTTEAGPVVFGPHPDGLATPQMSLGVAHHAVDLRLVDGDGKDTDEGVLQMRCPAVTPGYHGLPEKTASVMTKDNYYHTTDVMRRDENGFYYFVGRDDDMFVCNGENIFPEEVERLLESHAEVAQSCVVPVEDEVRGHMPVAFVVRQNDAPVDEDALKQHTIANGPAYQHPRRIFFVEQLPLASTNKVDRRELGARATAMIAQSAP
jgi:long-chain acyl-CoA synthetase